MPKVPAGFDYRTVGDDVVITHHGRRATTLRGAAARAFLVDVETGDPQHADGPTDRELQARQ